MGFFRTSRNLEASLIDHLRDNFVLENWTDIVIEKSFARVMTMPFNNETKTAVLCVRASDTHRTKVEIGTESTKRDELVLIDVFASSDGQRLDLVDFIGDILQGGFPYYEYQIDNSNVISRVQSGRCRVTTLDDKPVNFNIEKSAMDVHDRYRHLISLSISLGKVEN